MPISFQNPTALLLCIFVTPFLSSLSVFAEDSLPIEVWSQSILPHLSQRELRSSQLICRSIDDACRITLSDREKIAKNKLEQLKLNYGFFADILTPTLVLSKISGQPIGTYLLRPSSSSRYADRSFTVSFIHSKTLTGQDVIRHLRLVQGYDQIFVENKEGKLSPRGSLETILHEHQLNNNLWTQESIKEKYHFFPEMTPRKAFKLLSKAPVGTFLLRRSSRKNHIPQLMTLSYLVETEYEGIQVLNLRIIFEEGAIYTESYTSTWTSFEELMKNLGLIQSYSMIHHLPQLSSSTD
jgi:hypothetical protein